MELVWNGYGNCCLDSGYLYHVAVRNIHTSHLGMVKTYSSRNLEAYVGHEITDVYGVLRRAIQHPVGLYDMAQCFTP
jgi:hypothetical protein